MRFLRPVAQSKMQIENPFREFDVNATAASISWMTIQLIVSPVCTICVDNWALSSGE